MKVVINENKYLDRFIELNEQWITKYFELEKSDYVLAKDPERIIRSGGYILYAFDNEKVVGVCALFKENEGVYQLARMAVCPKYQGQGIGEALMKAALELLKDINATSVRLVSNTRLKSAINLYKKFGFNVVSLGQHSEYSRANIEMNRPV
ncbi:GNAT family N-acetyltransferase [Thalassotalea ponticola]|uniref:GNAT family N-acetyltransferase n=1 Tax=Thalassotalea ponticola TaxID=1523392 RepID=UPI0025B36F15|nr:GNAT family N-acetyltransferase [Thalassotalea ponticola]MDN3651515.1 GNAT family N-acetyltransferase [Thalassotalea ponticola]